MKRPFKVKPKKKNTNGKQKGGGRPTLFTQEVILKLEEAYRLDATDAEACLHADVSTAALYKFQNRHPEFIERKDRLKQTVTLRARFNVARSISDKDNPDMENSKWWLERRAKREFSTKVEQQVEGTMKHKHTFEHMSDKELDGLIDSELQNSST